MKLGWNLDTEQTYIAQFLLDNDLRGIIYNELHPNFDRIKLLNTINDYKPESIHIITDRRWFWSMSVNASSTIGGIDQEVKIHNILNFNDTEIRNGSVILDITPSIIDWVVKSELMKNMGREIPKLICYIERGISTFPWINIARFLCPMMPHPLYTKVVKNVPGEIQNIPLSSLAILYNVVLFPEFIHDEKILKILADDNEIYHSIITKWTE